MAISFIQSLCMHLYLKAHTSKTSHSVKPLSCNIRKYMPRHTSGVCAKVHPCSVCCCVFHYTKLPPVPSSHKPQVCLSTDTVKSVLPPSPLQRKGPKCCFNGSFYRLSPSATYPRSCTANLHMGLCLGSPIDGVFS